MLNQRKQIKIVVIDGSPSLEAKKNEEVFKAEINNVIVNYIYDETINPNIRIKNHIEKINSRYVLRLLEDCVFRCETFIDDIISDCETLELLPENSVIIHPFIDTDDIIIDGQTLRFPLPNLNRKKR